MTDAISQQSDFQAIRHALDLGLMAWRATESAIWFREAVDALKHIETSLRQAERERDDALHGRTLARLDAENERRLLSKEINYRSENQPQEPKG